MIKLTDVCKVYQDFGEDLHALKSINLEIGDKGMVFLLGKSGSGKSTLLNCLAGFDACTSGSIEIDGVDIAKASGIEQNEYRKKQVGYVAQDYNLLTDLSIGQNLELVAKIKGVDKSKQDLDNILHRVGLKGVYPRSCKKISGGQKQRVAIARALVGDPKVIFADEPTGNLDGDTSEVIFGILKELSQSTLVVVVSHDAESAVKYGDRIIKIENGKIVDDQVNLCQQTTQKMSEFPNGHPDNAGADNRDELSLSNAGETKDTKTPKSSNKQKGLSLSFAMRLGLGIIKKHLLRFVAVAILPVLFVGFVGVMVTMFTFDVNRRQLQLLYKYDSISNTMAVKAEWPRRDDNDFHWWQDNMPDALFGSEDGFFAQEQINDYASYGKVVLSVNDFDTSMYFAPQNGGGWSSTFESLYKMSSQSQWYSSEGKMVLWDDANGVGDVSNFEQIDAKGLVCGKMPNDQGGVLISDFVFNAYQKFGYKFADGPRVEVNSMQEFLDNKPLIDVRLKNNLEAVEQDAISTPIVGIYATKMNLDDAKEMYQKNFGVGYNPYRVYAPVSANMMVMGKQFFETNLAKNIKPRYKYAIVPKSGKKSKDIRYTKKSYQMREDGYMAYANAGSNNSDSKYLHNPWSAEIGGQFVGFGDFEMQSMRSSVRSYRDFFWVIAPAFVVVTVALSAYFAASTMASSRKQIGILRGLGASGKDIFAIYASESLIGTLITFGFGVVLVHTLLATTFNESQWFLGGFIPGIAQYGILLGGLLASTVLGVLGPMLKVCRRKPVEAIRAGAN